MALWAQLQDLPEESQRQIHMAYGDNFPIEVRCALAQWIEDKPWGDLDQDNPQHENFAFNLVRTLIEEIDATCLNFENNIVMKFKLQQASLSFKQNYANNPFLLVRIVKQCLSNDMKVIEQTQNCVNMTNTETKPNLLNPQQEINRKIEELRKRTSESDEELRRMQQEKEQFVIHCQELQKRQLTIQQLTMTPNGQNVEILSKLQREKESLDSALKQRATNVVQDRITLIERHQETFMMLQGLQHTVLDDELIRWKRGQQLCGNGVPYENNLDQIQDWCEALAELIWLNRQQVRSIEMQVQQVPIGNSASFNEKIANLNKLITSLLSSLVTSTFIIEKQPPQVMKTNTRFTSTVRLLVGGKLNVHMTPPQVKVTIISEMQANSLLKNDKITSNEASGEILNNSGQMEYHQMTRQLTVNFRNMQLRKIKRAEKKGTESVMDEKFSLLFQSQFKVGGGELVFQVWTLSLPVVVIVHGNQEPHAWATVTWDNAFAEPGRIPFVVPEKVPWSKVGEVLSKKFKAAVGSGLKEEHLHFLACKALRNANLSFQDYNNTLISWAQFSKDPLPDRNFTFWEWFYAILKVTREHLRNLWNDNAIMGFVSRKDAEEMLAKKCSGTFLLRFSDSELGGITIAWTAGQEGQEAPECYMLQPFTSRNLAIRGLADCINDLKHLVFLYPDISKDASFGKYYTPFNENQSSNGYVRPELIAHIPGFSLGSSFSSYPNTPQSAIHNPHSPSESSIPYHDNPSIQSSMNDMNVGGSVPDIDMDFMNMDFMGDMDVPVDFSNINVNDLMAPYNKST